MLGEYWKIYFCGSDNSKLDHDRVTFIDSKYFFDSHYINKIEELEKFERLDNNPLWKTSLQRIFYLYEIANHFNIDKFIHFDNDVIVFKPFDAINTIFENSKINITKLSKDMLIFGYSYIDSLETYKKVCDTLVNIYENKKTIRNTEKIRIKEKTAFEHISDFFDYSRDSIKSLNPSYIHGIVPGNNKNELNLPIKLVDSFVMQEEEFYAFVKSEFDKREKPLPDLYSIDSKLIYKVKYGEFLGKIARKFGVKVLDIKRWNNLKNDNIRENQKLIIFPKRIPKT